MEKDIKKNCNAPYPDSLRRSSKPVQYFTFGKDNCLVHHPTSNQNKKSSSNAIFCRTNPFQTQVDKTSHKKVKSTLPISHTQYRYTPHSNKQQELAISKLTKKLKQVNASSSPNPDFLSIIIEGKSMKLNPKNYNYDPSTCGTATYCKNIKRCKMCGEVMVGLDPSLSPITKPCMSRDSCSDCKRNKIATIANLEEKITKASREHNPKMKRCVMCSKLFIRPYDSNSSSLCEKCPSIARFKVHENGISANMTATTSVKQNSSSKALSKNVVSSISICSLTNKHTNCKAAQSVKSAKLPAKNNDVVDKLTQPNTLISEHSKRNIACKKASEAKPNMTQTKSKLETNRLATKFHTEKATSGSCSQEPFKNASMTKKKASVKKSNINSIAKSLSEANRFSVRSKNTTEEFPSKNYLNRKQYENTNKSTTKTLSKIPNRPSQSRALSETNQTVLKSRSATEEFSSESSFDKGQSKGINVENKRTSFQISNVPTQTQSVFETNQLLTNVNNTSEEFIPEIVIDIEERPSTNMSDNMASTEDINRHIQTKSLIETVRSSTETSAKEKFTQEIYIDRQEFPNTSKSSSTEDLNMPKSLSETNQIATKSKHSSEKITPESQKLNMANKCTSTDKLNIGTQTELFSQLEQDFLLKCAHILGKEVDNSAEERPSSHVLQNVTVNNYCFLTGSYLMKALCSSSLVHNISPAKRTSSESVSLISVDEDNLEGDKAKEKHIEAHINPKNSSNDLLQSELTESVLERLYGAFEYNADVLLPDSCQSQFDISLYSDTCSTFESDHFPKIDQSSIKSNHMHRLYLNNICQTHNQDVQCLYGFKSANPYTRKSLMLSEEINRVRNEHIDQEKILEDLKKNKHLMKIIDQMAAKKLNFSKKSTVFKNLTSK